MKLLLGAAALIIILAGIRATSAVLIPLVLAMFLALICFPLVHELQARRVHKVLAVVLTMLAVLGMLVGPGLLIVTAIRQFTRAAPEYEEKLRGLGEGALEWLRLSDIDPRWSDVTAFANPASVFGVVVTALTGVVTLLSLLFLVVLFAAFMLVEAADMEGVRRHVLPVKARRVLGRVAREMQTWLRVKTIISMGTGLAAGAWVGVLGIDFALLWGIVAFLFNYIPNIGSLVAAVPPALIALIQFGPVASGVVVLGYVAINAVFGSILEPYLMGRRIGLSPLVVLLSVIVWGWMWGVAGMLLAVPITMAVKFGLESSDDLRWVADMLGGSSRDQPEPAVLKDPGTLPAAEPRNPVL